MTPYLILILILTFATLPSSEDNHSPSPPNSGIILKTLASTGDTAKVRLMQQAESDDSLLVRQAASGAIYSHATRHRKSWKGTEF